MSFTNQIQAAARIAGACYRLIFTGVLTYYVIQEARKYRRRVTRELDQGVVDTPRSGDHGA